MKSRTSRALLLPLLIAACGVADAQAPSSTSSSGGNAPSANIAPPPATARTGPATDTQDKRPMQMLAECDRLLNEQPTTSSSTTPDADAKAKREKCQKTQDTGAAPR